MKNGGWKVVEVGVLVSLFLQRQMRSNVYIFFSFLFSVCLKRKDFENFAGSARKVLVGRGTS